MLPRRELIVGKSYINEEQWMLREVVAVGRTTVTYITFRLNTGELCGSTREDTKRRFILWADREATPDEMALLQHQEVDALYQTDDHHPVKQPALSPEQIRMLSRKVPTYY